MLNTQRLRYRILMKAMEQQETVNSAILEAEKGVEYVLTGKVPVQEYNYIEDKKEQEIYQETKTELEKAKKENNVVKKTNVKPHSNIDNSLHDKSMRVLSELISDHLNGVSNKTISPTVKKLGLSGWDGSITSKYLQNKGYIKNLGTGPNSTWKILKYPDGNIFKNSNSKKIKKWKTATTSDLLSLADNSDNSNVIRANAFKILQGLIEYEDNGISSKSVNYIANEINLTSGQTTHQACTYLKDNGFVEKQNDNSWKILKNLDGTPFNSDNKFYA